MSYQKLEQCRVCGNTNLQEVVHLGEQSLTGVFPAEEKQDLTSGPLSLVKCHGELGKVCHLLQLGQTYNAEEMYGINYGYRSGLNPSMVKHLSEKVEEILQCVNLERGDVVLDIGSNDGTTLGHYPLDLGARLIGIDPTGGKFSKFYADHVELIEDFFSEELIKEKIGHAKAKVITSFSMFYDLEDPVGFAQQISNLLDRNGIWVLEQSYMPEMVTQVSYDTVCHEHLEYYGLRQIDWIAKQVGLKIVDVSFNHTNGGSFSVVYAKKDSDFAVKEKVVNKILDDELEAGYGDLHVYSQFNQDIHDSKEKLIKRLEKIKRENKKVYGLGASTKGNVILQFCGISKDLLPSVGEVNDDKFGHYTPGTMLPIVSEDEIINLKPDYLLVLPWHFKAFFEKNEKFKDIELIYPL